MAVQASYQADKARPLNAFDHLNEHLVKPAKIRTLLSKTMGAVGRELTL